MRKSCLGLLTLVMQDFYKMLLKDIEEEFNRDFPGGAVVKNPPASAVDTGSIPRPGRSHMLRGN